MQALDRQTRKLFKGTAQPVNPLSSNAEILESIGCNFHVKSVPPQYEGRSYDAARLWLRSDNHDMLGAFGNRRQVIQPTDFLDYFRTFTQNASRQINLDLVGTPDKGRTFYMASRLGGGNLPSHHSDRAVGDRTDTWLLVADYYGHSAAPKATLLFNELVCTNGMVRNVHTKLASLTHLRKLGEGEVSRVLEAALSEVDDYQRLKVRAQNTRVTMDSARKALRDFFGEESRKTADLERIYEQDLIGSHLAERQGTAWGLLNAVTQYTSHSRAGNTPEAQGRAFRSQLSGARGRDTTRFAEYLEGLYRLAEVR
ncbi:MAG: DUF932 domain-containing protein [Cyanobacteria bacterium J06638_7]